MPSVKITISDTGKVAINDVMGGGASCVDLTRRLEAAFGGSLESTRTYTDEYTEETTQSTEQTNG